MDIERIFNGDLPTPCESIFHQARTSGAMEMTLALLKNFVTCMQGLPTLLRVLRFYVLNKGNASRMGKSGGISCMLRLIKHCGKRHQLVQKLALNALTCMCQPTNQEAFFLGVAGISDLLKVGGVVVIVVVNVIIVVECYIIYIYR